VTPPRASRGPGPRETARLAIRFFIGRPLIIRLIIQTFRLCPSRPVWTDRSADVSRHDPTASVQSDGKHPARNRKVEDQNPSSGSIAGCTQPMTTAPTESNGLIHLGRLAPLRRHPTSRRDVRRRIPD